MTVTTIGGIGMGLMWGWLLVLVGGRGRPKRPFITILALILATILVALQLFFLTGWPTLPYFLASTALSLMVHLGWRQELRKNL